MTKTLIAVLLFTLTSFSVAATLSPIGRWATIDDETGEIKSQVTIWEENGELKGRIDEIIDKEEPTPRCGECKGERKDQPIEGMIFIWGLKEKGDGWAGGTILDPANGKEYKAKVKVAEEGAKLEVRGFIGFAVIGRTQVWNRLED